MKGIFAAEWKLCSQILSSAICPFKLHCNTGRVSQAREKTRLPAVFLRSCLLSIFLCSPASCLAQGWLPRCSGPGGWPRYYGRSYWSALRPVSSPGWRVRATSLGGGEEASPQRPRPALALGCVPRSLWKEPRTFICVPFPILPGK